MRRRELLLAGAVAAVARPAPAHAQGEPEEDALAAALQFEHATVLAYDTLAPRLDGEERGLARRLRAHEAAHAEALAKAMTDRGWKPPDPPRELDDISFPQIRAAIDAGGPGAIVAIEALGLDVYAAAIGALRDARHIQLAATILAAEASHVVAWRTVR